MRRPSRGGKPHMEMGSDKSAPVTDHMYTTQTQQQSLDTAVAVRRTSRKDHGQYTVPRRRVTPLLAVQPCASNRPSPTAPQHGAPSQSPRQTHLVHVENQVELAHILKTLVQRLDEHLQQVHDAKRRLGLVDRRHKEERGVLAVDEADTL